MKYSSANKPLECFMTQSTCYKGTGKMTVRGVLWHSTGANNPTLKRYVQPDDNAANRDTLISLIGKNTNGNDWNHIDRQAGLNCWIGKLADGTVTTVQTMPWDYKPWGCGSGSKGSCNNGWIQFEICEDALTDSVYFNKVYNEACELTAYLCKMFGIDPNGTVVLNGVTVPTILCHADSCQLGLGSNHGDVNHWFPKHGKSMATVRTDVAALLQNAVPGTVVEQPPVDDEPGDIIAGDLVYIRSGATYYSGKAIPAWVRAKRWFVASVSGDRAVIDKSEDGANSIRSPINVKYLCTSLTDEIPVEEPKAEPTVITPSEPVSSDEKTIWDYLYGKLGNAYGVAGLMGNLFAESALKANNLQNTYATKFGMSDAEYTAAVDNGSYTNFVRDSAGYGLAQWTFWSRKQALLAFAQEQKKSIGDLSMQLDFLWKELQGYSSVMSVLKSAFTVLAASNIVLTGYERPANQGDSVKKQRAAYGQKYYDLYAGKAPVVETPSVSEFKPYIVKVTASELNIRKGAGTNCAKVGCITDCGCYTIVEEKNGWGKLKSGVGWICLSYTRKL